MRLVRNDRLKSCFITKVRPEKLLAKENLFLLIFFSHESFNSPCKVPAGHPRYESWILKGAPDSLFLNAATASAKGITPYPIPGNINQEKQISIVSLLTNV